MPNNAALRRLAHRQQARDAIAEYRRTMSLDGLHKAQNAVEYAINATPTGTTREMLTVCNMLLLEAVDALEHGREMRSLEELTDDARR